MRNARAYMPAFVLFLGCAFVWNARKQEALPLRSSLQGVLAEMPGYRVEDAFLSDEERRVAGMTSYVARVYWRDSVPAFTTFVSYYDRQTQGATIHSPKNCLPGAGWEILSTGTTTIVVDGVSHEVNRNVLKNQGATALVYYWYQGRGRLVANEYQVKWNLLRDAALAGHTEESLVRVVVPVPPQAPGDTRAAELRMTEASALASEVATMLARQVKERLPAA